MEDRVRVREIRFGVTGVEAAFASTGCTLMMTGSGKDRSASLLPLYHIALIPFSRLYRSIEASLAEQHEAGILEEMLREGANLTLITGASKSTDIAMSLTLGAHGPQVVHAILFDDGSEG
ncbi:MAG: LUD domain-containing protein [Chloroflexota bacterium]|nr:LUD domain-containing protein [Chloroflexota bacterium]